MSIEKDCKMKTLGLGSYSKQIKKSKEFSSHDLMQAQSTHVISQIEQSQIAQKLKNNLSGIAFVAPILPHLCELNIWNEIAIHFSAKANVYTSKLETANCEQFMNCLEANKSECNLNFHYLETLNDNPTFLSTLEDKIKNHTLLICYDEISLATFQVFRARKQNKNKIIIWQNAPRPLPTTNAAWNSNSSPVSSMTKLISIRTEILKSCDAILSFDKESANWSYIESVEPQRLKRIGRGINFSYFNAHIRDFYKEKLRENLGLKKDEIIFMHLGPLEIDSGVLDTLYAFKTLKQCHEDKQIKLCYCGQGKARALLRQTIVSLELDNNVIFISTDQNNTPIKGNRLTHLLPLANAVIHNIIGHHNALPNQQLDTTYDILCAASYEIPVLSNGNGWIGGWLSKFQSPFSSGNIHSLSQSMAKILKQETKNTKKILKALYNEFQYEKTIEDSISLIKQLTHQKLQTSHDIKFQIEQIEKLVSQKQYIEAIEKIQATFTLEKITSSEKASLYRLIADSFTKLGDLQSGFENYMKSLELDSYNYKTYIGLGTVSLQNKSYTTAIPQFEKAIKLAPHKDLGYLGLSLAFEGLGEKKEALKWTCFACQRNIQNTASIYNIVKLSFELNIFSQAEEVLRTYLKNHPHDVNMIYNLGGILFKQDKTEEALSLMNNILAIDPMYAKAHALINEINKKQPIKTAG